MSSSLNNQQDMSCHQSLQTFIPRRDALKALFGMASASVLFGLPSLAHAAQATQETLNALADAQAEYDEVQAQMNELSAQFEELSAAQDKTISQIEEVQLKIEELEEEIEQKKEELARKQKILSERVSTTYKDGDDSMLALLLSSSSFEELISNVYYVNKVNERDQAAIQEVRDIQAELEQKQSDLKAEKAELEDLKAKQAEQLEQMKAKKDEVSELLSSLSDEVQALVTKRDEEILAAAQAEEAARRAAATNVTGNVSQLVAGTTAQERIVSSCNVTPSPGAGWCAAWVTYVFMNAGLSAPTGNADDMYNAWCTSSNLDTLKVGMIIAVSTHSHTWAGSIYGHVGIYVGNNTVMENVGPIRSTNLSSWISYYGTTVTPRWGWACGVNLEG